MKARTVQKHEPEEPSQASSEIAKKVLPGQSRLLAIGSGGGWSCALVDGGVRCWGFNGGGQLGNYSLKDSYVPVSALGLSSGVTALSTGYTHNCAIVRGSAFCWGWNHRGQVGNAERPQSAVLVPVPVDGLDSGVSAITTGEYHTCAIVQGRAKCWGGNIYGQLGNETGSYTWGMTAVPVEGLPGPPEAIAAGGQHTCAIVNGGAYCWGDNTQGQLGNNSRESSHSPVQVLGLTSGVSALALGQSHSCAIVHGAAVCWGSNEYGKLGNNSLIPSLVPVAVEGLGSDVTAISSGSGSWHTCAIVKGAALCWGENYSRQLGNNLSDQSLVPIPVQGLSSGVSAIAAGGWHTCAVVNGAAMCWGDNSTGELGNNTIEPSSIPVRVLGLQE